jgi:hypothetical protein
MAIDQPTSEVAISCLFDSDDADIILLSKNPPTELHVHKVILAAGSPFFHDMFTLPQPPSSNTGDSKPVIPVTESRDVITTLLQFVYPLPDPQLPSLNDLAPILDAAIKYDFPSVISTLRRFLSSSENLQKSPIQVYAISSRFDLEEEAQIASSHTLSTNLLDGPLYEDLKYISAWQYHRLLDLHRTRSKSAQQIIDTTNCPPEIKCMQCNSSLYTAHGQPKWYYEWEKQAKAELAVRPVSDVIFSMEFIGKATKASECARCSESVFQCWTWLEEMKRKMDALPTTI